MLIITLIRNILYFSEWVKVRIFNCYDGSIREGESSTPATDLATSIGHAIQSAESAKSVDKKLNTYLLVAGSPIRCFFSIWVTSCYVQLKNYVFIPLKASSKSSRSRLVELCRTSSPSTCFQGDFGSDGGFPINLFWPKFDANSTISASFMTVFSWTIRDVVHWVE
jgi:hypothetical protein